MPSARICAKKKSASSEALWKEWLAARYFPALLNAVSSPQGPLTSVFGMGTGVSSPPGPPAKKDMATANPQLRQRSGQRANRPLLIPPPGPVSRPGKGDGGEASRPIRNGRVRPSRALRLHPVNPVVFRGSSEPCGLGRLVSGGAWRLDAFSAYPFATWLPGNARRPDNRNTRGRPPPVLSY